MQEEKERKNFRWDRSKEQHVCKNNENECIE